MTRTSHQNGLWFFGTLAVVLTTVVFLAPSQAQGPGPRPPGGFTPPGPNPGMPRSSGYNPGTPVPPGPAAPFNPGTGTPPPAWQPPQMGPTTMYETVWYCKKCNAQVGTGPVKPTLSRCPSCGGGDSSGGTFGIIGGVIAVVVAAVIGIIKRMSQ